MKQDMLNLVGLINTHAGVLGRLIQEQEETEGLKDQILSCENEIDCLNETISALEDYECEECCEL